MRFVDNRVVVAESCVEVLGFVCITKPQSQIERIRDRKDIMREEREVLTRLIVDLSDRSQIADACKVVDTCEDRRGCSAKCRASGQRTVQCRHVGTQAIGSPRIDQSRVDRDSDAARYEIAVLGAEPQIVTHLQFFIGVIRADQPIEFAIEGLTGKAQFLSECFKVSSKSILGRSAVENIDSSVIGVRSLTVGIFTVARDRRQRDVPEIPIDLSRNTVVFGFAFIASARRRVQVAVECILGEGTRILPKRKQHGNDRICGTRQGGPIRWPRKGIKSSADPCKRSKLGLDERRGTARFVLFGIIPDKANGQVVIGFEQELTADQITIAIVDRPAVGNIVVEAVALKVNAVHTRSYGVPAERLCHLRRGSHHSCHK